MKFFKKESLELSIVLPCLNEGHALGYSIREARRFISDKGIRGEIIVVDNGSSDDSPSIALSRKALLLSEDRRGYGYAIRKGLRYSRGRVIVIADSDSTYDLLHLDDYFYPLMENKADFVIGNRFTGKTEKSAMPLSHRLGSSFLSALARLRFRTGVRDFHCGLRSIRREALEKLDFRTGGMEFATEFVALCARKGLRIREVACGLRRCRFKRRSKLNVVRDGLRHLGYILSPSP